MEALTFAASVASRAFAGAAVAAVVVDSSLVVLPYPLVEVDASSSYDVPTAEEVVAACFVVAV